MGLMALGFKQAEARKAVDRVLKEKPGADSAELIRLGLRG
jgi:Holliday junction resolvasome RuvABC DNA-binding subunit